MEKFAGTMAMPTNIATPPRPQPKAELWSLQSSRISIGKQKYTAPYKGKTLQSMASYYK